MEAQNNFTINLDEACTQLSQLLAKRDQINAEIVKTEADIEAGVKQLISRFGESYVSEITKACETISKLTAALEA